MSGKAYRVPLRKNFEFLQKNAKRESVGIFDILLFNNSLSHNRIAVVIPKKIIALAVERHKIKRLLLARLSEVKFLQSKDVVVFLRSKTEIASLGKQVDTLLKQLA